MLRFVSTIILAVLVLSGIWYLPVIPFQIAVVIITGIGLWEYGTMIFQERGPRIVLVVLGVLLAATLLWFPIQALLLLGVISVLFLTFLWGMWNHKNLPETTHFMGAIVFGVLYLGLTIPFWGWLKELGREWVMLTLFPACLTDTFGFLVGKTLGRHKLAPTISPNKTWEGFAAGLCGGVFGLWLATKLFFAEGVYYWNQDWIHLVVIGASISLVAVLGDLFESLIKRSAGVKDSSNLIPGHGGILDRLDALTFVPPFFYFFLWYVHR